MIPPWVFEEPKKEGNRRWGYGIIVAGGLLLFFGIYVVVHG